MQIYVTRNGQQFGPYDEAALKAGLQNGSFTPADLVWYEGAAGWTPLSTLPGMAATVPADSEIPPPPPSPQAAAAPMPRMVPLPAGAATMAASGKKPTPKWVVWLSTAVAILGVLVGLLIVFGRNEMLGTKYKASATENVNYSGKATEADARKLADALKAEGYFGGGRNLDVLLKKEDNGRTIVSFVVTNGWQDENLVGEFKKFGEILVRRGVGSPMTVRMIDTNLNMKRELPIN